MNFIRHINIILMALQNLRRFKGKTIAIIAPLSLTMAVCSFMMFTRGGFIKDAEIAKDFLPDVTVQQIEAGRVAKISTGIIEKIKQIPHVEIVVPRVWGYLPLNINGTDISYTLMGLDIKHVSQRSNRFLSIKEGRFLTPEDHHKAVLGYGVAQNFGFDVEGNIEIAERFGVDIGNIKKTGDDISVHDILGNKGEFQVIGIFDNKVQIYSADLIVVSNEDARNYFGYAEDEASDLLVYADNPANADRVALNITQLFDNTRVLTGKALTQLVKEAFGRRGGTFQAMWLIMLVTVLLIVWAQSSHIGVDVGRETGILKAVGWRTGEIIEMKMIESLFCGLAGSLTGILIGLVYALMGTPGISGYCLGCASIYPKFPVPVSCDSGSLIMIFILGVAPVTVVSAIPAWHTGTIDPDECIRS